MLWVCWASKFQDACNLRREYVRSRRIRKSVSFIPRISDRNAGVYNRVWRPARSFYAGEAAKQMRNFGMIVKLDPAKKNIKR